GRQAGWVATLLLSFAAVGFVLWWLRSSTPGASVSSPIETKPPFDVMNALIPAKDCTVFGAPEQIQLVNGRATWTDQAVPEAAVLMHFSADVSGNGQDDYISLIHCHSGSSASTSTIYVHLEKNPSTLVSFGKARFNFDYSETFGATFG